MGNPNIHVANRLGQLRDELKEFMLKSNTFLSAVAMEIDRMGPMLMNGHGAPTQEGAMHPIPEEEPLKRLKCRAPECEIEFAHYNYVGREAHEKAIHPQWDFKYKRPREVAEMLQQGAQAMALPDPYSSPETRAAYLTLGANFTVRELIDLLEKRAGGKLDQRTKSRIRAFLSSEQTRGRIKKLDIQRNGMIVWKSTGK